MKCGLGTRTVQARIKDLAQIGLIEFKVSQLKTPGTYKLLPVRQPLPIDTQPMPDVEQPLPNDTQRTFFQPLPTLEESREEDSNNKQKKHERELTRTRTRGTNKIRKLKAQIDELTDSILEGRGFGEGASRATIRDTSADESTLQSLKEELKQLIESQ